MGVYSVTLNGHTYIYSTSGTQVRGISHSERYICAGSLTMPVAPNDDAICIGICITNPSVTPVKRYMQFHFVTYTTTGLRENFTYQAGRIGTAQIHENTSFSYNNTRNGVIDRYSTAPSNYGTSENSYVNQWIMSGQIFSGEDTFVTDELLNVNTYVSQQAYTDAFGSTVNAQMDTFKAILDAHVNGQGQPVEDPDDDPYADVGDNEPGGGGGDFDDTSEDVNFPSLPSISVSDAGFVTVLNPSLTQLRSLSSYLWSTNFDISQVKKLFANPMDVFIGLSIVPVSIPSSSSRNITVCGVSTGVTMDVAQSQFIEKDMGSITIKTGTGGSYLDYSPYTKASIYLPYIGWRDISIDDIMGKTVHLKYHVDIVSGACNAYLKCGGSVLYEWSGQCAVNIPLTSIDFTNTARAAISAAGHIGGMLGGVIGGIGNAMGGNVAGGIGGGISSVINGTAGLASDALSAKPTYPKSGSLAGAAGTLGIQTPYICLVRPRLAKPKYQSKYMGYPSFVTRKISDMVGKGFNAFSDIRLQGLGLTQNELDELESILKGGVFL